MWMRPWSSSKASKLLDSSDQGKQKKAFSWPAFLTVAFISMSNYHYASILPIPLERERELLFHARLRNHSGADKPPTQSRTYEYRLSAADANQSTTAGRWLQPAFAAAHAFAFACPCRAAMLPPHPQPTPSEHHQHNNRVQQENPRSRLPSAMTPSIAASTTQSQHRGRSSRRSLRRFCKK